MAEQRPLQHGPIDVPIPDDYNEDDLFEPMEEEEEQPQQHVVAQPQPQHCQVQQEHEAPEKEVVAEEKESEQKEEPEKQPDMPRQYQVDTFERVKKENLIINMRTGTGKTLIAAMAVTHFLRENPGKIAVFIVSLAFHDFCCVLSLHSAETRSRALLNAHEPCHMPR